MGCLIGYLALLQWEFSAIISLSLRWLSPGEIFSYDVSCCSGMKTKYRKYHKDVSFLCGCPLRGAPMNTTKMCLFCVAARFVARQWIPQRCVFSVWLPASWRANEYHKDVSFLCGCPLRGAPMNTTKMCLFCVAARFVARQWIPQRCVFSVWMPASWRANEYHKDVSFLCGCPLRGAPMNTTKMCLFCVAARFVARQWIPQRCVFSVWLPASWRANEYHKDVSFLCGCPLRGAPMNTTKMCLFCVAARFVARQWIPQRCVFSVWLPASWRANEYHKDVSFLCGCPLRGAPMNTTKMCLFCVDARFVARQWIPQRCVFSVWMPASWRANDDRLWKRFPHVSHFGFTPRAPSQYKDRLIYVWRFPC